MVSPSFSRQRDAWTAKSDICDQSSFPQSNPPDCNPEGLGPFPIHGPLLCGFHSQSNYNVGYQSVLDAFELARTALDVLTSEKDHPSIRRYFDVQNPGVAHRVINVLRGLVGPDGRGSPMLLDRGFEFEVWRERGSALYARWEAIPNFCTLGIGARTHPNACSRRGPSDLRKVWVDICPDTLERQPGLNDIPCGSLADQSNDVMYCPGSVLLHEFVHWSRMTREVAGIDIYDWVSEDPNAEVARGYGA